MSFIEKKPAISHCYIGLINPKSPSNVGAVLRAAGCYAAEHIYYTGNRYERAKNFATDTKDMSKHIGMTRCTDPFEQLPTGTRKVAFELVEGATPLPDYQHHNEAIYLFGPEDGTIPQNILDQCDDVIYVPTQGCMNLAASVNVLLYDRQAKSSSTEFGDNIIKANRDTNNKTRVKGFN